MQTYSWLNGRKKHLKGTKTIIFDDFWEFFEFLNTHSESIKLKAEIQLHEIHFLDATLLKRKRFQSKGLIDTKVNFKATDSHQ